VEGSHPDVAAISGQSAIKDATPPIGIETPTGVRKGVRSRGRKRSVQPMGVTECARRDSGEISAPMGAGEFHGDLYSPEGATRSHGVREKFSAPMGAGEFEGVRVAEGHHGTNGVDHATDRFASGLGRHESGAATPSDVADRRGIDQTRSQ